MHTIHGDIIQDGVITGGSDSVMLATWGTHPKQRAFTASIHITVVSAYGTGVGISDITTAACTAPCQASGQVVGAPAAPGVEYSGILTFTDAVARGSRHENIPVFTTTPVLPAGYETIAGSGRASTKIRCDEELRGVGAGCVLPEFTPTVDMSGLEAISKNIRGIQQRGGYGIPGDHARALHRLTNASTIRSNRRSVCARSITGAPPETGLQCDEYPFASTKEGGTALGTFYRGWDWVPAKENSDQGYMLSILYRNNRVLDGDEFWVRV
ncbi:NucA/NucB deoxyribonuclease domain-containing protein [Streptomyces sp. NRRL S-87]|uniref:NucA/NucB deoxyribonuclease domain-containing protein n=1 Tax=Streptomyces sp. NRRL S-87 TaxID=1463920 RepID=UPI0004BE8C75|nr:NucA/NucB deoxyribonuclease domain-containing protein [Streptomyces sp. NRRL S-87]